MMNRLLQSPAAKEWLKNGLTAIYALVSVTSAETYWSALHDAPAAYLALMLWLLLSIVGFRFLIGRVVHYGNDPIKKITG